MGESVILPCQVQHDPLLDIMFTWYFNGALTDFKKDGSHFEKVGGVSCDTFLMLFTSVSDILSLKEHRAHICYSSNVCSVSESGLQFCNDLILLQLLPASEHIYFNP